MLKISTEIGSAANIIGKAKAIENIAKAGFDAWDFSMFDMVNYDWASGKADLKTGSPLSGSEAIDFAKELKKIGDDNGIYCNQSHAPFPSSCKEIRDLFKKAIELTAVAGGEFCVIHPDNYKNATQNAEMYCELLPFAKQHNVKIATENMWNREDGRIVPAACSDEIDFKRHLDAVSDEYFVACVDIGHAEMRGLNTSAEKMIRYLGDKVRCLHIHDNDLSRDCHQIPFSMNIDFSAVVSALKKIGYKGVLTLEADAYLASAGYRDRPENISEGLKKMRESAEKIRNMFY